MEVADEGVGLFEASFDGFELQLGGVEPLFDVVELGGDPVLFGLQEFERDCSGVVRFEELAALVEQLSLPRDEPCAITDVVLSERDDLLKDHLFGLETEVVAELDVGVVVLDRFDDSGDVEGTLVAAVGVALSAEADEVGVDSGATSGVADDQAAAAAAAPDGALQVVVVGAAFLSGVVLGFEDALDFVEDGLVDKHGVLAGVSDAAVFDDPCVVARAHARLPSSAHKNSPGDGFAAPLRS